MKSVKCDQCESEFSQDGTGWLAYLLVDGKLVCKTCHQDLLVKAVAHSNALKAQLDSSNHEIARLIGRCAALEVELENAARELSRLRETTEV